MRRDGSARAPRPCRTRRGLRSRNIQRCPCRLGAHGPRPGGLCDELRRPPACTSLAPRTASRRPLSPRCPSRQRPNTPQMQRRAALICRMPRIRRTPQTPTDDEETSSRCRPLSGDAACSTLRTTTDARPLHKSAHVVSSLSHEDGTQHHAVADAPEWNCKRRSRGDGSHPKKVWRIAALKSATALADLCWLDVSSVRRERHSIPSHDFAQDATLKTQVKRSHPHDLPIVHVARTRASSARMDGENGAQPAGPAPGVPTARRPIRADGQSPNEIRRKARYDKSVGPPTLRRIARTPGPFRHSACGSNALRPPQGCP